MSFEAAVVLTDGAILIDEYDSLIFDDVYRNQVVWRRIDHRLSPGETTGGFDQTAVQTARAAPVRNLGFSATSATRTARTRRDIKAIVSNLEFTMFDRSVYQQQGRRFGDLEAKDVRDMKVACLRDWQRQFYLGDTGSDSNEFDGLRKLLGDGTDIGASDSVLVGINSKITSMMNTSNSDVLPTAIYLNARVLFLLEQELLNIGNKLMWSQIQVGQTVYTMAQLATPAGLLPLIVDPFNSAIAGTPSVYPTFIVSEDKLSWQYVEVLGMAGSDPKTFEIALDNGLDQQYTTVMFGALELLGGTRHHARINVYDRTATVDAGSKS